VLAVLMARSEAELGSETGEEPCSMSGLDGPDGFERGLEHSGPVPIDLTGVTLNPPLIGHRCPS
jgi:hypothetical protein